MKKEKETLPSDFYDKIPFKRFFIPFFPFYFDTFLIIQWLRCLLFVASTPVGCKESHTSSLPLRVKFVEVELHLLSLEKRLFYVLCSVCFVPAAAVVHFHFCSAIAEVLVQNVDGNFMQSALFA